MAIVVNNPSSDAGTGVASLVLVIVAIAVIGGLFFWYVRHRPVASTGSPDKNLNVNVTVPSSGNTTGGGSGTQQ